jgi:hypothetical protein
LIDWLSSVERLLDTQEGASSNLASITMGDEEDGLIADPDTI